MARFSAQNPDGHHFVGTAEGLILLRSPLWTRDWEKDHDLPEEENKRRQKAAVAVSRDRWLETMKGTLVELAWRASNVARTQPGRATRIGRSRVWMVLMPLPPRATGMDCRRERREARRDLREAAHQRWAERIDEMQRQHGRERAIIQEMVARARVTALPLERAARKKQMSQYPLWDGTPGPVNDLAGRWWDTYAEMGEAVGLRPSLRDIEARARSLRTQGSNTAADAMFEWARLVRDLEDFERKAEAEVAEVEVPDVESDGDDFDHPDEYDDGHDNDFERRFGWRDDLDRREPELVLMDGTGAALVLEDGDCTLRHGHYAAAGDGPSGARRLGLRDGECMWCGDAVPCGQDHRIHVAGVIGHIDLACRRGGGVRPSVVASAIEAVQGLGEEPQKLLYSLVSALPLADAEGIETGATEAAGPAADGSTDNGASA
jgi:hypothetical protein